MGTFGVTRHWSHTHIRFGESREQSRAGTAFHHGLPPWPPPCSSPGPCATILFTCWHSQALLTLWQELAFPGHLVPVCSFPRCSCPCGALRVSQEGGAGSWVAPVPRRRVDRPPYRLSHCRLPFPPGDRVTFNGKECVCQKCSLHTAAGTGHPTQGLWSKWLH